MKKIVIGVLMIFQSMAMASQLPRPLMQDDRIKVIAFNENAVVPLYAATFTATEIQFGKEESIRSIQNGDVAAWTVDVEKNIPNVLFVKPTISDSNTNMTVITSKHTYYFHLMSVPLSASKKHNETYALRFVYPAHMDLQRLSQKSLLNSLRNPNAYHWGYSFHGSRSIMPLHVFDDGRFTYVQLRSGQAMPAIFVVETKNGNEAVVNFRRKGKYLVIHRVAPQFTLREGRRRVASIFNDSLIVKKRKQG